MTDHTYVPPAAQESISIDSITATQTSIIYANTKQEVIIVTRDKLHLCLQQSARRMTQRDRWQVPLGVLVPLALAVATTSFTKRLGVSGTEWQTVFIMLIIFTVFWLIRTWMQRGKSVTVDAIVEDLAKNPVIVGKTSGSALSTAPRATTISDPDTSVEHRGQYKRTAKTDTITRPILALSPGDRVTHDKFGIGTVVEASGSGDQAEAKIDFGGEWKVKHLVLRYAPLEKL